MKLTQLEQGGRAGLSPWNTIPVWLMRATGKLLQGKGHPGSQRRKNWHMEWDQVKINLASSRPATMQSALRRVSPCLPK